MVGVATFEIDRLLLHCSYQPN